MPGISTYVTQDDIDLANKEAAYQFMAKGQFTHVVNCEEYADIDRAEEESGICTNINTNIPHNLAINADDLGYRIIQLSTDQVFDGVSNRPYLESDKVNPISQYGATKRKAETALIALAPECIILRTGWHFSEYGRNFVANMIEKAKKEREIDVVSDQIGAPTYSCDLANAIIAILTSPQWVPGVFNFSNEGVASRYDFAKAIFRIVDPQGCRINPIPATDFPTLAPRPYYSVLNISRIKATYNITIPHWEESLRQCISQMQCN